MDIATPTVSPLRQRMLDDMRMRKMAEHTVSLRQTCMKCPAVLANFIG